MELSTTVKDDLNFARRGNESTCISVSIWNTLLFPPTSDLIYRMKWQTDVCIPNTRSPTILKTSSPEFWKHLSLFCRKIRLIFENPHFLSIQDLSNICLCFCQQWVSDVCTVCSSSKQSAAVAEVKPNTKHSSYQRIPCNSITNFGCQQIWLSWSGEV